MVKVANILTVPLLKAHLLPKAPHEMSEVTHSDSLCVRLSNDATASQVKVSNAARHGKTAVDIGLANTIPGHKATTPLDSVHGHTYAHTTINQLQQL